jgi:tRNA(fMet)-specific endonuclease VapC
MRKENNYYDLSVRYKCLFKLLNNSSLAVTHELAKHQPDEIYLSTVVQLELYYGAYKSSRKEQNLAKLERC